MKFAPPAIMKQSVLPMMTILFLYICRCLADPSPQSGISNIPAAILNLLLSPGLQMTGLAIPLDVRKPSLFQILISHLTSRCCVLGPGSPAGNDEVNENNLLTNSLFLPTDLFRKYECQHIEPCTACRDNGG